MTERKQFKLPDVGEGLTEAEIVKWHVQVGDQVEVNQTIVEIETAKAVVELPCPFEGTVGELMVEEGATVDVGVPIIAVDVAAEGGAAGPAGAGANGAAGASGGASSGGAHSAGASSAGTSSGGASSGGASSGGASSQGSPHGGPTPTPSTSSASAAAGALASAGVDGGAEGAVPQPDEPGVVQPEQPKRQPVLVGYGVKPGATKRRPRKQPSPPPPSVTQQAPSVSPQPSQPSQPSSPQPVQANVSGAGTAARSYPQVVDNGLPLAKPPVRKMAKDLGVDLSTITGTGPRGSITREDVQQALDGAAAAPAPQKAAAPEGEREERIPVRGVRKATANAMVGSAFTAPHVTTFLQVDVTRTVETVARLRTLPEFAEFRVSPLLLVAKALLTAVARYPMLNSSWADAPTGQNGNSGGNSGTGSGAEIVVKHYVNLGIAAATERGLIVPNVKDAHTLSLPELAQAFADLTATARAGKASPADLTGGTISITNVGVFGVDAGTPIITPGEAAILCFGQIRDMPWVHEGELTVRKVTTLALSFDHRIIDGELGSKVLRDIGAMLEDPVHFLAWS
ncbi:dihydrolipoamide acetyltransferase family protein [Actinomadura rupiterrae]|uniref:dihydrolipoamide acetyltransferase family protein n=1 Tax=Actinomadura rupiterrae TaxID=559627 RepID=UPI0020A45553|nr:dihydrolipoamide acetyltransferase family protein [Actinomadura rupiterrae]MCP2337714.1 pyruvate dehydrogenase E2 component (dihydrolipoamide acetyltransferase) [Actinomadura rupiterrae]